MDLQALELKKEKERGREKSVKGCQWSGGLVSCVGRTGLYGNGRLCMHTLSF